ncbi:MarR family winged helix-turn-helix transcriptional regulator [Frigoribacterium faeni]|nr:MarR family winged helix-turn-helix transcriptional regulator [Frigoribacterium faeni]MBA8814486.1 DNA-binding MarR family transcriptional regulator [Frigoribacterium faeni]
MSDAPAAPALLPDDDFVFEADTSSGRVVAAIYAMQDAAALFQARLRARVDIGANELVAVQYLARLEMQGIQGRPKGLAAVLGVTSSAASIIVTRLVSRGYVTREANPHDGRGQVLALTRALHDDVRRATGGGRLGALGQVTGLSERESNRVVRLLGQVTSGYADSAVGPTA